MTAATQPGLDKVVYTSAGNSLPEGRAYSPQIIIRRALQQEVLRSLSKDLKLQILNIAT
jgi:hypothetical protein